jgi:hypothetical protein
MFASAVTESEVESVKNILKGNSSARFDEIPQFSVKCCLHNLLKTLTHVFNIYVKCGNFPDLISIQKIGLFLKRVINIIFIITDEYLFF